MEIWKSERGFLSRLREIRVSALLKISIVIMTVMVLLLGILRALYPHDNDQTFFIWITNDLILSGKNPWNLSAVHQPPYCMTDYGVFFHYLAALGQGAFGDQFWFLRAVSLISFVVVLRNAFELPASFRHASRQPSEVDGNSSVLESDPGPSVAVLSLVCSQIIIGNMGVGRADMLGLVVTTTGVCLLLRSISTSRPVSAARLAAAGILVGMGPLLKQNYISGIIVGSYVAWHIGRLRPFAMAAVGLPGVVTAVLTIVTAGGFLEICLGYPSMPEKTVSTALKVVESTFLKSPSNALSIGALALAVLLTFFRKPAQNRKSPLSFIEIRAMVLWWFVTGVLSTITSARTVGGSSLYWIEFFFVSSSLLGMLLTHLHANHGMKTAGKRWLVVWTLLIFLSGSQFAARSLRGQYFAWNAIPYYQEIQDIVTRHAPPDLPIMSYFSEIPRYAGRTVWFNDPIMYLNTTPENREMITSSIRDRKLSCLLLQPQFLEGYLTSDYVEMPTRNPFPNKIFAVKLYLRRDLVPSE